jgi:hypothetical protein
MDSMTEAPKQQTNYLPLIIVGVVLFFVLRNPKEGGDPSTPTVVSTAAKALPGVRTAFRDAFLTAADKIESGEIKNQEQWLKFIGENCGSKYREAMDSVYSAIDKLDLPASFEGKESEIAKLNREIGRAW